MQPVSVIKVLMISQKKGPVCHKCHHIDIMLRINDDSVLLWENNPEQSGAALTQKITL